MTTAPPAPATRLPLHRPEAGHRPAPALVRDPRVENPGSFRVAFVILLDGDLVMSPEHLGVGYMAAVLRRAGFTVSIHEMPATEREGGVEAVVAGAPHLVCFTLMSLNVVSFRAVAAVLRARLPQVVIACGGPAGTFAGIDILRAVEGVDVVAMGEGEPLIFDLVQHLYLGDSPAAVAGIAYRSGSELVQNEPSMLVEDLDTLPFPARDQLSAHGDRLEYVRVSTSRGCIARCSFCSAPHAGNRVQHGKLWRGRSVESVLDELSMLVADHGVRTFDFVDSTFEDPDGGRIGKARIAALAEGILDRGLDIYYNCCMRAENWSDDDHGLLDLLMRSGLEKVNVGIESGVDEELRLWDKRATVADNVRVIRLLREHDIYLAMGFIPFHPYATLESVLANAAFLREHAGHNLRRMTERLEVYPGTPIVARLERDGLLDEQFHDTLNPYAYRYRDHRVAALALHFASLYNNTDYHERGLITEQSRVFEFETFNVVVQTFVSRLYRRFHTRPGCKDVIAELRARLHEIRQEIARFNHGFFLARIDEALDGGVDGARQRHQVAELERFLSDRMRLIRTEQLRAGRRLHRLQADVREVSSTIELKRRGPIHRTYTGGVGAVW